MSEQINKLFEECIGHADDQDLEVLNGLLQGIRDKQKKRNSSYIGRVLHMERAATKDSYEITIPVTPLVKNSLGIVHGGITATVIDSAMGSLAMEVLPEGQGAVTTQLNIHYIGPGIGDSLTCKAQLVHKGSKTIVLEAQVYRPDGKKVAHATGSFFIIGN
ncbi:PaaI family thioesterase [Mesobacillus harenae]|uniref:PaaI family thioesterase n=1 Tax=Mesobacillus harenae TaxID=2213203 RepID=UPI001580C857|nr:PaaI family thioesterase [Mesobacillus harenae]